MFALLRSIVLRFRHLFRRKVTVQYPEEKVPGYRRVGGAGSCCPATRTARSGAWPATSAPWCARSTVSPCRRPKMSTAGRYPEYFRINFSRCIFCGYCEEACPTYAIQLTPDVEMAEYRRDSLVYEKEDLLIDGPGKYPEYNFYRVAGVAIGGKDKGEAENEDPPVDLKSLLP